MYIKLSNSQALLIQFKVNRIKKFSDKLKEESSVFKIDLIRKQIETATSEISELMAQARNQTITIIPEETLTEEQKELLK